ncbi:MAG: phytanoyl-CoA dioxygenase family protein [bacterium]|nr:phytanoyl-CoA dioxygenase family protein [bacterium]
MHSEKFLDLKYQGRHLGNDPSDFGELNVSNDALCDRGELERRMGEDGYLFLKGLLNKEEVAAARQEVMNRLMAAGVLDRNFPAMEGIAAPESQVDGRATGTFMPALAGNNPPLDKVIHEGPMIDFYTRFLGGPVSYFDYTWFRCKRPGVNTATTPHCDIVYMGRGTKNLYTSWIPYGDVPLEMGGLILLEGSHKLAELKASYGSSDVDVYCENEGDAKTLVKAAQSEGRELTGEERRTISWNSSGAYSSDAIAAREELGGRWLTTNYEMGDVLVFCMYLMHASADNGSNRYRISSDTRYQLASEPQDERWMGENPPAHGIRAKRGMVC